MAAKHGGAPDEVHRGPRRQRASIAIAAAVAILVLLVGGLAFHFRAGSQNRQAPGDDTRAFCKIAATSSQNRSDAQVDAYYDQLKKVAPKDLVSDIATLRSEWKSVSIPLGEVLGGNVTKLSRPPEVTKAAKNVMRVVSETCGVKGGVYVVMPQYGF